MEIADNKVVTSTTSDVDDCNTPDAAEVGNDVDAEEEKEYPELYFVPDDKQSIVIIKKLDDITKTTITTRNNDTTTTTVICVAKEEGMMAKQEEDKEQLLKDNNDNGNGNDTNDLRKHSPTNAPTNVTITTTTHPQVNDGKDLFYSK